MRALMQRESRKTAKASMAPVCMGVEPNHAQNEGCSYDKGEFLLNIAAAVYYRAMMALG